RLQRAEAAAGQERLGRPEARRDHTDGDEDGQRRDRGGNASTAAPDAVASAAAAVEEQGQLGRALLAGGAHGSIIGAQAARASSASGSWSMPPNSGTTTDATRPRTASGSCP